MNERMTPEEARLQQLLRIQAEHIDSEGVGEVSAMCRQSILHTMREKPEFFIIYENERKRFTDMAYRLAPPALVAEYIRVVSTDMPLVIPLPASDVLEGMGRIVKATSVQKPSGARGEKEEFTYTPEESRAFFKRIQTDPDIILACIYLSITLQSYITSIFSDMKSQGKNGADIMAFGQQFNATNIITTLPIGLHMSLTKLQGKNATIDQLDVATIEHALKFMHDTHQFEAIGKAIGFSGKTETVSIKCPMEGYVNELLVKHNGFLPILKSTRTISSAVRELPPEQVSQSTYATMHRMNMDIVTLAAGACIQDLK